MEYFIKKYQNKNLGKKFLSKKKLKKIYFTYFHNFIFALVAAESTRLLLVASVVVTPLNCFIIFND